MFKIINLAGIEGESRIITTATTDNVAKLFDDADDIFKKLGI